MLAPPAGSRAMSKKSSRLRSPPNRLQFKPWSQIEPRWLMSEANDVVTVGFAPAAFVICANVTCHWLKQLLLTPFVSFGDPLCPVGHVAPLPPKRPEYQAASTTPLRPATSHGNMLLWFVPASSVIGALQPPVVGLLTLAPMRY